MTTPTLERLLVHPIKSLDAVTSDTSRIVENGGLEWDRRYAIVDADGEYVNGKRERRVHRLRSTYDLAGETVTIRAGGADRDDEPAEPHTFHLEDDRGALDEWLSTVFGYEVRVRRNEDGGFPDDTDASGPTVISTGTLETVASWFDEITPKELRRRLRPNLVVDALAFWEDRLYDEPERVVPFEIGGTDLHGVNPCQRCVVPTRDPDTGAATDGFRERFVDRREQTLPAWAGEAWFDHYFRLMVNTSVPRSSWGNRLERGDAVTVGTSRPDSAV